MAKQRRLLILCLVGILIPARSLLGQSTNAAITGQITDPLKGVIVQARVTAINNNTNVRYEGTTNQTGSYLIPSVPPGDYRIEVEKTGFKTIVKPDVILHVQDTIELNFEMALGSASETVTVTGGAPLVNTESAAVSTVVDRQFAENLPMNGRSFQTLIELTPGVVATAYNFADNGQFSVNGQRAASNYWMVDGVSANIGIGTSNVSSGNGLSGANAGFSALGGTNSLVSVDALQEFRIQTSTFAPEFGRTPGGQISIVTRSGTSHWHGSAFDYLRNDKLDANDWFANANSLAKPKERQNDFGGTFSGPIIKERTFFFFSYEGLRLRLPQVAESLVPDMTARQNAVPAMQPFLNAFPVPNGPSGTDDTSTEIAQFNASYSNSATLDAYSLRVDHKVSDNLSLFARYNYSPSKVIQRTATTLSNVVPSQITIQTATAGATWTVSPAILNDLRFNFSRTASKSHSYQDSFGNAVPLTSLPFPSGFNASNGDFTSFWFSFPGSLSVGPSGDNLQRQINLVDSLTLQKGSHNLKFGVDFRRLFSMFGIPAYGQQPIFVDVPSSASGTLAFAGITSGRSGAFLFHNFGAFAQDTWRATRALTLTYGLRWDVDFAPSSTPSLLAVTGFNLSDLSNLALASGGTPPFQTTYGNVAPRLGIAYQLSHSQQWQTVLRGGFGVFYDLATSNAGQIANNSNYPFGATKFLLGQAFGGTSTFPLSPSDAAPPVITAASLASGGKLYAFDPNLKLPYTLEWTIAVEQSLGVQQTVSVSYVGSAGRRLLQTEGANSVNANFSSANLITNVGNSDYDALQVQFQRRLSRGLQALASYTWSHSIDTASAGSGTNNANLFVPGANSNANRGPSDFDIRNAFSAGVTYEVPTPKLNAFANALLRGWSIQNLFQARSAPPVSVYDGSVFALQNFSAQVRPDVVAGQPLYLFGSQYPGGKAFNPKAFTPAPRDSNGKPVRQGDLGRNALRAFGAWQWDFAAHRDFAIRESLKLQFRAEMFNVLNHPNFAPPVSNIRTTSQFGLSTQTLGNYLAGSNIGSGAFNPLYQIGGPRSVQFALKLLF